MESKKGQEISSQLQQTADELNEMITDLYVGIQSLRSRFKEIDQRINDFRVELFTNVKESKKEKPCVSTSRAESKKFQEPLAFVIDMKDTFGKDTQSDLISGLQLFLETPSAVSSIRNQFNDDKFLSIMIGIKFGFGSQRYLEYIRILELHKSDDSDVSELDSQLDVLFKDDDDLRNAVKRRLKN